MEVMLPSPAGDFNCGSTCTTPHRSAPGSPQGTGNYFYSAPSSPTNSSLFYRQISFALDNPTPQNPSRLQHEDITNTYISEKEDDDNISDEDFAFDFSGKLEITPPTTYELFDCSKIQALPKKTLQNAVSFRQRKKYSDPCTRSATERRPETKNISQRGSHNSRTCASNMVSELTENNKNSKRSSSVSSSTSTWYEKWKLTDLLFRSASQGHETRRKYDLHGKSVNEEDTMDSPARRKKERVAAHEFHYKVKKVAAAEMRRKTFLPYKQNLMGCMDLDGAILEPSLRGNSSPQMMRR